MNHILHTVPIKDLQHYYTQIEGVLDIEAFYEASQHIKPFTTGFDELQFKIFDQFVEEAMIRQFIGTHIKHFKVPRRHDSSTM